MKKLFFIGVASLAMIMSSCGKKNQDAAQPAEAPATEVATEAVNEAAAVTESAAFTAAQEKIAEIQKQIEAASTIAELAPVAAAVEAFKAEMATVASSISEGEKATLSELFKNVIESAQKKEAELKKN